MVCRLVQFVIVSGFFASALRLGFKTDQAPTLGSCPQTVQVLGTDHEQEGVKSYQLKYSEAPRWEEGKLVEIPSTGAPLDATGASPHCLQATCLACGWKITPKMLKDVVNEGSEGQEDCLFISYFIPKTGSPASLLQKEATGYPIVFHVHHGQGLYGFKMELPEVKKVVQGGIAAVTANMRLGAMGVFAHPDQKGTSNLQVSDLTNALRHVQKYACVFGANPNQVTITGSSSGANGVAALLASPPAKGLFHRAWLNSPVGLGTTQNNVHTVSKNDFHEKFVKPCMTAAGCDSLACMKGMEAGDLMHKFQVDKKCSLARYNSMFAAMKGEDFEIPGFPYDDVVPNMMEGACKQNLASAGVPVVVGHAKDELDSLKFQFPDMEKEARRYFNVVVNKNLAAVPTGSFLEMNSSSKQELNEGVKAHFSSLAQQASKNPTTESCVVSKLMGQQEGHAKMEDSAFNLGSYMFAGRKNPEVGPRWHFTITAPSSVTGRAWHTTPELMVWNATRTKTSPQYDALTKEYVTGNASPQLTEYMAKNFQHFVKYGTPEDTRWPQTDLVSEDELGGLPSVDLGNGVDGEVATVTDKYHHHHHSMNAVHCLTCNKKLPEGKRDGLHLQNCVSNPNDDVTLAEKQNYASSFVSGLFRDMNFMRSFTFGTPEQLKTLGKSVIHDMATTD